MGTEEDTFRKLKQIPYLRLYEIIDSSPDEEHINLLLSSKNEQDTFLEQ